MLVFRNGYKDGRDGYRERERERERERNQKKWVEREREREGAYVKGLVERNNKKN